MKQTRQVAVALALGFAVLGLAPAAAPGAGAEPGFETYIVRRGDTLTANAGRLFGDAKRWREILKENPQVTDPNRIYPGDSLRVAVPEKAVASGPPEGGATAAKAAEEVAAPAAAAPAPAEADGAAASAPDASALELPVENVRPVAVVNPALYRSAGSIADGLPAIAIVASEDERELLATYDAAIIPWVVNVTERTAKARIPCHLPKVTSQSAGSGCPAKLTLSDLPLSSCFTAIPRAFLSRLAPERRSSLQGLGTRECRCHQELSEKSLATFGPDCPMPSTRWNRRR